MLMESSSASQYTGSLDFGFAFDDANFSDRTLRIEILQELPGPKPDQDDIHHDLARNRKRRRGDALANAEETTGQCDERGLNYRNLALEDLDAHENQEDEAAEMIDESPVVAEIATKQSGHEAAENDEFFSMDYSPSQVKTIHISSPILAAKSPFFYKLFSNGPRESDQREVTLQIQASEEDAFMDLLKFMYSNTLSRTTPSTLLDVLLAADKYEVESCVRFCTISLCKIPMTVESALRYLELRPKLLRGNAVIPLVDAARFFLAASYQDLTKFQDEVLNLPLPGLEAVLLSNTLQVASEDAVYDLVLKWARIHYPNPEERRDVLSLHLRRFIRFPCMTTRKLRKVLTCGDICPDLASKVVLDALFFKAEAPKRQCLGDGPYRRFVERAYKYRPVKVVEFESPHQSCVVYLDLKRGEIEQLFPSGRVYSQAFHLGGQGFFLSGHCNMDQQNAFHCFGLFLGMQEKGSVSFAVEYEFASRIKLNEQFVCKYKGNYTFTGGKAVGYRNLFGLPWAAFVADDSPYFINGVLHLRAELVVRK
ncbi:BTB/POZ domain-containing protein At2g46260-like isoform X2 [Andrographis paniculata]|uniref:BTB/POZ domain-containing protein At2g46260-like isoform X2 n=1 Tax=Andrographis paniculata TaxID=175694 RepID=UPI0021E84570|nr:BTB/POZ domain-containing protein At2g46260-like isoform X2 [Andrographis paniculata]